MKDRYTLYLRPDGDIEIWNDTKIKIVYHKTFNPGEKIKDNLIAAYEEWERLDVKE